MRRDHGTRRPTDCHRSTGLRLHGMHHRRYVPLDQATPRMIVAMCFGWISNHTSQEPATLLAAAIPADLLAKALIGTTLEWQQDYVMRELEV